MAVPVVATIVPLVAAGNTPVETGELETLFNKAGSLNALVSEALRNFLIPQSR